MKSEHEKGIVLVKSTGGAGLGDMVRAVLSGLHYAQVTGRALSVLWDDGLYGPVGENIFNCLFDLSGVQVVDAQILQASEASVRPQAWRRNLRSPLNRLYGELRDNGWNREWAISALSFDQTCFDYEERVLVMWDFDGFVSSWNATSLPRRIGASPDEALRMLAKRHLHPAAKIRERVRAFRGQHFLELMIGVHVRKTFETGGPTKQVHHKSYLKAIEGVRHQAPDAGVFLSTDNSDIVELFERHYPSLLTRSKWFPTPGQAIHISTDGPDRLSRAEDAAIEMWLLGECDYLIYPAASSFGITARILSDIPDELVAALQKSRSIFSKAVKALFE